jgi:hypothetical protein
LIIRNAIQIKEFEKLPAIIDKQCELCFYTAVYIVKTVAGLEFEVCQECFSKMLAIESLLGKAN